MHYFENAKKLQKNDDDASFNQHDVWKQIVNTEGFIRTKHWMPINMLGTFCQDGIFARQHNLHEF